MYYRDEDPNRTGDYDYFANFMGKLTGKDPDDLEFYEKPPISFRTEFTMEQKMAFEEKERQIQLILNGWQKRWGGK